MRDEERLDGLHVALARLAWDAAPIVRLHHHAGDDTLVAEFVQADAAAEVLVHDRLLIEFDAADDDAMPVALYLTGLRADPHSEAASKARAVLGEEVWAVVRALSDRGTGRVDVPLAVEDAVAARAGWRGLAGRLRGRGRRMIGIEFVPGWIHAVVTDGSADVLDEQLVALDGNEPDDLVAVVDDVTRVLAGRSPDPDVACCPVAVQLGGPVHTPSGTVEYYDKPLHDGDPPWKEEPLGERIRRATGRRALVFNDASALAIDELECGLGRELAKVAVLVVRQGIGAKLVYRGAVVDDFPMEIGVFIPATSVGLDVTPDRALQSIEAGSGVKAIAAAVAADTGRPCPTVEVAALLAEESEAALAVFGAAGAGLARVMAAVQTIVSPDAWVVHGPAALVGEGRGARAFLGALGNTQLHLHYSGLRPGRIVPRPTSGRRGARAAAVAALSITDDDGRRQRSVHRNERDR